MKWRIILCLIVVVGIGLPASLDAAKKKRATNAEPAGTPGEPAAPGRNGAINIQGFVYKNTKPEQIERLRKLQHG